MSYEVYKETLRKIQDVSAASALMSYDQEVFMPKKSAALRAQQLATLSSIGHKWFTDPAFGELLKKLAEDTSLSEDQQINVRESLRDYTIKTKLPSSFIEEKSRTRSAAFQAWIKSRRENSFEVFKPHLEKVINLNQREADILGYEDHPYNALLDQYERDARVKQLDVLFDDLKTKLQPLIDQITNAAQVDNSVMQREFNEDKQWQFGLDLLEQMGYDFDAGRQDRSEHPFTISFSPNDVRVTTRVSGNNFTDMTWSCIHEGGHALYEQGLPVEQYGLPLGESISLGIHESQSRIWENNVGRSYEYWQLNYPKLKGMFPDSLGDVSIENFYRAVNKVSPSFIRVDADELTYHFHIIIRYEVEKGMLDGSIKPGEAKEAWNAKYKEYLGIDVPDDKRGVLQDVHWSHGGVGYFPTYTLGSLYAAQFFAKADEEIGDLKGKIAKGELHHLLDWLRKNIHQYGRRYTADELCNKICGESLNAEHFMKYAREKYSHVYSLDLVAA